MSGNRYTYKNIGLSILQSNKQAKLWFLGSLLGYNIDTNGLCVAIGKIGAQGILLGKVDEFNDRVKKIDELFEPFFFDSSSESGSASSSEESSEETDSFESLNSSEESDEETDSDSSFNERLAAKILAKISPQFLVDLKAFFDAVSLYQDTNLYAYLFPEKLRNLKDCRFVIPLISPVALKSKIISHPPLYHSFNQKEFKEFMDDIKKTILSKAKSPVVFHISGAAAWGGNTAGHLLTVGFDPHTKKWYVAESNFAYPIEELEPEKDVAGAIELFITDGGFSSPVITPVSLESDIAVNNDLQKLSQNMLEKLAEDPEVALRKDAANLTPLMRAILNGDVEWVESFLKKAQKHDFDDSASLIYALPSNRDPAVKISYRMFELLIEKGFNVNALWKKIHKGQPLEYSALIVAVNQGDILAVHMLLNAGAEFDKRENYAKISPFFLALEKNDYTMVNLMLMQGANPSTIGSGLQFFVTQYEKLIKNNNPDALALAEQILFSLIEHGADVYAKPVEGESALEFISSIDAELSQRVIKFVEDDARNYVQEIENYIKHFSWELTGLFGGTKITIGDKKTIRVSEHAAKQWGIIEAAKKDKITYVEAAKLIGKIAVDAPQNKWRKESTQRYYDFFKSSDRYQIVNQLKRERVYRMG